MNKPAKPPRGASGVTYEPEAAFTPADAVVVCDLLRNGRTNPDLWTRSERAAVTRLHQYR